MLSYIHKKEKHVPTATLWGIQRLEHMKEWNTGFLVALQEPGLTRKMALSTRRANDLLLGAEEPTYALPRRTENGCLAQIDPD